MDVPRDSESLSFEKTAQGLKRLASLGEVPEISGNGTRAIEAWFLGPKGENVDVLERLVVEAIRDQAFWRKQTKGCGFKSHLPPRPAKQSRAARFEIASSPS